MSKRRVEIFSAGCPTCDDAIKLVQSLACPSCEVQVLDMHTAAAQTKAKTYDVRLLPAVVVNGKLADCCWGGVDADAIRRLGIGTPA